MASETKRTKAELERAMAATHVESAKAAKASAVAMAIAQGKLAEVQADANLQRQEFNLKLLDLNAELITLNPQQ